MTDRSDDWYPHGDAARRPLPSDVARMQGEIARLRAALDAACKDAARVYTERDVARRDVRGARAEIARLRAMIRAEHGDCGNDDDDCAVCAALED